MKTKIISSILVFTFGLTISAQNRIGLYELAVMQRKSDNLCKTGDYETALKGYRYVLANRLPIQGNRHQDIGVVYNNMGVAHYFSGENQKAKNAFESALKIILTKGPHHPDVATIRCSLAFVLDAESKYDEASELYEQALKVKLRTFGEAHPDVADCQEGMALVKEARGERDEAIALLEKALANRKKRYGEKHTDVAACYAGLALAYLNKDNFEKAGTFDEKAKAIFSLTKGGYPPNLNPISRLRPKPPEMLRARSKSLRNP
jgi:tetratricopeptide (TPR) repeat protein